MKKANKYTTIHKTINTGPEYYKRGIYLITGIKRIIIGKNVTFYPPCIIYHGTEIGDNSIICANTVIRENTKIGHNSVIGTSTVIEGDCEIGNHTTIHSQCHITKFVKIGDWCFIAPFFLTTNTPNIKHGRDYPLERFGCNIGFGVRIGGSVTVAPKINIGDNVLIGLSSLILKDIPKQKIAFGNPAKIMGIVPNNELLDPIIQKEKCKICSEKKG